MIDLAAQFRFWTADLSGISDAMLVKAALNGDKESARDILQRCYWRMYIRAFKHEYQHLVIKLLGDLAFDEIPLNVLQKQKSVKTVMRNFRAKIHPQGGYRKYLKKYDSILGDEFLTYLEDCFDRAVKEYWRPRLPDKMRRRKNWLAIGFNLAWAKDNAEGQSENLERNSDITQSVYLLIEQYDKKHGNLRSGINRFLNGESDALPGSIDRLIKLKGFIDGGPYIDHYRKVIARLARRTIFRFETAEQGSRNADHRKLQIASHIFAGCSKACKKHLSRILADIVTGNTSACSGNVEDEIVRINERLATLNSYGAEPVGKGKKGTGPTGIAKIYSANRSKFENVNLERASHSDIAMDELLKITPVIGDAIRLIDSMQTSDDCDAVLAKLNALRKQSPADSEHLWRVLIQRFNVREAAFLATEGKH